MGTAKLKLIGYWYDPDGDRRWPHPSELVDVSWAGAEKAEIVRYLRSGVRVHEDLGYSHCRFEGGPPDEHMGNAELTDGVWIWPEGLWLYVEKYSVRLPDELREQMRLNRFEIPGSLSVDELEEAPVDEDFWARWCEANRQS
jgi:hypothetical protein